MKSNVFHNAKYAKVTKHTYSKGPNIGDYFFTVHSKEGHFIAKFGNRSFQDAIKCAEKYSTNNNK